MNPLHSSLTTVVFMGDLWHPRKLWGSRYLWIPLEMEKGSMRQPPPRPWTLNSRTGETTIRANRK